MAQIDGTEFTETISPTRSFWRRLGSLFGRTGGGRMPEAQPGVPAVSVDEVRALIRYVAERGGVPDKPTLLEELSLAVDAFEAGNPPPTNPEEGMLIPNKRRDGHGPQAEARAALISKYAELCEYSYPRFSVYGRSIIDSAKASDQAVLEAFVWGVIFLALAIGPDIVFFMFEDSSVFFPVVSGLVHFSAFFWGGVGSSVFLLKTFSEIAADSRFDRRRLQGIAVRVFLGAAMAYIVVEVFGLANALGETSVEGMPFELTAAALAFLTGLGVRAFYGAFEALVDAIHDWFARPGRSRSGS